MSLLLDKIKCDCIDHIMSTSTNCKGTISADFRARIYGAINYPVCDKSATFEYARTDPLSTLGFLRNFPFASLVTVYQRPFVLRCWINLLDDVVNLQSPAMVYQLQKNLTHSMLPTNHLYFGRVHANNKYLLGERAT